MKKSLKNDTERDVRPLTVKRGISPKLYVQVEESINKRQCWERISLLKKNS